MRKFVASYAYLLFLMLAVACFVISGRHYGETEGPMLFLVGAIFLVLFMATMPSNGQEEEVPEHENREWLLLPANPQEGPNLDRPGVAELCGSSPLHLHGRRMAPIERNKGRPQWSTPAW